MISGKTAMDLIYAGVLSGSLFLAAGSSVAWTAEQDYEIEVVTSDPDETLIMFRLNTFRQKQVAIDGKRYTEISLENSGYHLNKGLPQLPRLAIPVMVPADSHPEARLEKKTSSFWNLGQPVPSKGDFERNLNPARLPWVFSDLYHLRDQETFPELIVEKSRDYQISGLTGTTLRFSPFIYHWETGLTEVISEALIRVETSQSFAASGLLKNQIRKLNQDFIPLFQNRFVNFRPLQEGLLSDTELPSADRGELLIISHPDFIAGLSEFVAWKRQLGFRVYLSGLTETGAKYQDIKAFIQKRYDEGTCLSYVLLVGDSEFVPFHPGSAGNANQNEADPMYGLLEGNDSYPEVPVARFSVKSAAELAAVVKKSILYEKQPAELFWYRKATGIASSDGNPTDAARAEKLRIPLLQSRYDIVDRIYDPGARAASVTTVLNEGRNFINYIGHGTETAWVTTWFDRQHIAELKNTSMLPVIISVACVNGRFAWTGGDSFAEAWIKAWGQDGPTGAVAIFASSTNQSWVPPTVGQAAITRMVSEGQAGNLGPLMMAGSVAVLDDGSYTAVQTFQTWHIFGDPTIAFRNVMPESISLNQISEQIQGPWYTEPGLRLTLSTRDKMIATILADESGKAEFKEVPEIYRNQPLTLTISGQDRIPLVKTVFPASN